MKNTKIVRRPAFFCGLLWHHAGRRIGVVVCAETGLPDGAGSADGANDPGGGEESGRTYDDGDDGGPEVTGHDEAAVAWRTWRTASKSADA